MFSCFVSRTLDFKSVPYSTIEEFIVPYTKPYDTTVDVENDAIVAAVDVENPLPSPQASLPCLQALEFLADIWEEKSALADEPSSQEVGIGNASEVLPFRAFGIGNIVCGLSLDYIMRAKLTPRVM